MYNDMPPESKARFFLIPLAFALSAGFVYLVTESWNAAQDTLPQAPRLTEDKLIAGLLKFYSNPSDESWEEVSKEWKSLWSVPFVKRLMDFYSIDKYGLIETSSGRPLFVEPSPKNLYKSAIWGRGTLEEYEKAYPGFLAKTLGGREEAGEVQELMTEREEKRGKDTENAVRFMKLSKAGDTAGVRKLFQELREKDELTEGLRDKIKEYSKEAALGQGILERKIIGLKDEDQASFILDRLERTKTPQERAKVLMEYVRQGVLTDNVKEEMQRLIKERFVKPPKKGLFQGLFQ